MDDMRGVVAGFPVQRWNVVGTLCPFAVPGNCGQRRRFHPDRNRIGSNVVTW